MKHPDQAVKVPEEQLRNGIDLYQGAKLRKLAAQGNTAEQISQMLLVRLKVVKALMPKTAKPKAKSKTVD